jgi:hypothetical protein
MSKPKLHPDLDIKHAVEVLRTDYNQDFPVEYFIRDSASQSPQLFEIGLCFAGSVSAGAYLAGVADYLIEAWDCWEAARSQNPSNTPPHRVRLNAMSGTSGGGMTALILATSLSRGIQPARAVNQRPPYSNNPPTFEENPLYGAWVKGIGIEHLLSNDDLAPDNAPVQSFLNSQRIASLAQAALVSSGPKLERNYLANPLHVGATIGNLNGFAYQFGLRSSSPYGYQARVHEDVVRFAVQRDGVLTPGTLPPLPNERKVNISERPTDALIERWPAEWRLVAQAAMATGAFPVGLLPRDVIRYWDECDPKILPLSSGVDGRVALLPAERTAPATQDYSCLGVDGGTFNNEPFEIARTYLAGLLGSNARDGATASRAVIMVDPLVQPGGDAFERLRPQDSLLGLIQGLVLRAFVNQGRTHLREWSLAMADDIYSRYLLAPTKGMATGEDAICGSVLGAFGGFLSEAYREHDFRLGRRNCQRFLREHFNLPEANPLFDGWTVAMKDSFRCRDGNLPIIPLVGGVVAEEPEPIWPAPSEFETICDDVYKQIEKRVDRIYEKYTEDLGWFARQYLGLGWKVLKPSLLKQVHTAIEKALKEKKLY